MADLDLVHEAPYCVMCRRSSAVKWRKHVFSRTHQHAAHQFLLLQVARLQELCNASTASGSKAQKCVFCDVALATVDALTHFGSEAHKKKVESFCRHHRCDADRQTRPKLWLKAAQRRELEVALEKKGEEDNEEKEKIEVEIGDQAAGDRVEAFLTSAASRLREVETEKKRVVAETEVVEATTREQQLEALLGPQVSSGVRRCKTVTSTEGVLQNPLGRHEGKRVWGGGIVKLRKDEWIPWAIDQLVKEEQAEHPETQQTGAGSGSFVHRVTELARGEGLSSIAAVSWGASVGNVHTAAVPPWLVQSEEEYKKCNRREQETAPLELSTRVNSNAGAKDKKRKDIFSELKSKAEYGPNWLPNFGGVWQEGPRSKTKQAFRKAASAATSSRTQVPAQPVEPNSVHLTVHTRSPRVVPVKSQQPPVQPPPPPPPQQFPPQQPAVYLSTPGELPSMRQSETSAISSNTQDDKTKPTNPLDAKKQLLLAQKERLRAKMAARRRQL